MFGEVYIFIILSENILEMVIMSVSDVSAVLCFLLTITSFLNTLIFCFCMLCCGLGAH
jgi:hypothetical protein